MQTEKRVISEDGWAASPAQLAAAQAAVAAQKAGKDPKEVLNAARQSMVNTAENEVEQNLTHRYLVALNNRRDMIGRYSQLSLIENLDILASTSIDGRVLTYPEYKVQLQLIEKGSKGV